MIDNRSGNFKTFDLPIPELCDRRFGIGADGVIVIENHPELDFNMIYFNSDGSQSFCGNGSRCAVAFAQSLGMIDNETHFLSTDGPHYAKIEQGIVHLKMHDVHTVVQEEDHYITNTGSPHYIIPNTNLDTLDIIPIARSIRYNETYSKEGINVNFTNHQNNYLYIRTYERGVEDETLSCGTGVTAAVIADFIERVAEPIEDYGKDVKSMGGDLHVSFDYNGEVFSNIYLSGPAKKSYEGMIQVNV